MAAAAQLFNKIELNESPDLSMAEITEQLFNNEFMSDVKFCIGDKVVFAHSWELIKRSVVFGNQMRATIGKNKVIPIQDSSYVAFYQFIRFLYTDKCDVNEDNHIELIKLARKYKVRKLETEILNTPIDSLKLFEYCVLEKYDLAFKMECERVALEPKRYKDKLIGAHADVIEVFLKFDYLNDFKECELYDFLMLWIKNSCQRRKIPLTQCRSHFDKLFRLIRFPAMTLEEFSGCAKKHKNLFTDEDMLTIFKQISFGHECLDSTWNSKRRLNVNKLLSSRYGYQTQKQLEIKFNVSSAITLTGLRFVNHILGYSINLISFIAKDPTTTKTKAIDIKCNLVAHSHKYSGLLSLGDVIILKPNINYTVEYIITGASESHVLPKNVIFSGPPDIFQNLNTGGYLYEIIYKSQEQI